jgi:hypothetical protein
MKDSIFHAKKLNTKLEKRIFEAEKEYPAEKIKSLPNFFFEIFHTKVVTGVAEVQISNERPGVCEFYVLYNNNNNKN